MLERKVVIIGGGLAGLTCAIHLLRCGHPVTLIEKNKYPQHKVCGEFISNEVRSYWTSMDINIEVLNPTEISKFTISSPNGRFLNCTLPLGGFGISRYTLDQFLFEIAVELGCEVIQEGVENIELQDGKFCISTQGNTIIIADLVIGAYGKRSALDHKLKRSFFKEKSPWLAVKAHYRGRLENDKVTLHNFDGGYCGISKVENDLINVCYLTDYTHFKAFKNIEDFEKQVLKNNPLLKDFFQSAEMVFDAPLTISQISFAKKKPIEQGILMIGDTAGLIHPLCGNGMAMAVHSAKLCAELCNKYLRNEIKTREGLEKAYVSAWKSTFQKRLLFGRILSVVLRKKKVFNLMLGLLATFPALLPKIIKNTHGNSNI
jgi:flavin-dependent dehydrogenase